MVLEGEENVLDVCYIQHDGVVFLTLSIIKATHVSPVWLGMRGGSAAQFILDKKNSAFLSKLNISNPVFNITDSTLSLSTLKDKMTL